MLTTTGTALARHQLPNSVVHKEHIVTGQPKISLLATVANGAANGLNSGRDVEL